jgi:hypothetical protein
MKWNEIIVKKETLEVYLFNEWFDFVIFEIIFSIFDQEIIFNLNA